MKKKNINRYQLGKRVVSCALALGLTAGSVSFQGNILGQNVKAAQVTNVKDGWYYIKNVNAQKYLQVTNNQSRNGANVCQWSRSGRENQQWIFEEVDQSGSTQPSNPQPSNPQPSNPQPSKQIEVNCPASAMATRQGVAYGRYTHEMVLYNKI